MCKTRNPFRIARELGIHVEYRDDFKALKGMYAVVMRNRFIAINSSLEDWVKTTVCAHELVHDRLHQHLAKKVAMREFTLYDMRRRPEYEANIFAADILISDDDILELIDNEYDVPMIAGTLEADINLVLIKLDSLRLQGYDVRAPYRADSDFLGKS